jgi:glycosyltransferase involved in cell wall biosynthesis
MNKRLRIALLNDLLPPDYDGGLELSAYEIGKALETRGHDVQFVCCRFRDSYSGDREVPSNFHRVLTYADVRARTESRVPAKLEALRAIERRVNIASTNYPALSSWIQETGPYDVALVFGVLFAGLGTVRAFSDAGIPIVWSVGDVALRDHFRLPTQTRLYGLAFGTIGRKWHAQEKQVDFSNMMFVSEFTRSEFLDGGIAPKHTWVIPRAIDFPLPEDPLAAKSKPPLVFVASRLAPSRGPQVAVEAMAILKRRNPELSWRFALAGGGPAAFTESIRHAVCELGANAEFLGKLPKHEVIAKMREAAIFINPIIEVEGFGRTNIEALANGAALVASDMPSAREIAEETRCARFFPPGDAEALARVIAELLGDSAQVREQALRGLERVRSRYQMPAVISEIEQALGSVLSQ